MTRNLPLVALAAAVTLLCGTGQSAAQTYFVDFGSTNGTFADDQLNTWNTISNATAFADGATATLFDTTGLEFITLEMVRRFNGENLNGTQDVNAPFPTSAVRDSLFGNTEAFGIGANIRPAFSVTGLDPAKKYNFTFYASRTGVSDIRTTEYVLTGGITGSTVLNVTNNISNVASAFNITPDAENEILVELFPAADNNNGNHFTYLGVMKVEVVPEPTSALMIASGVGILALRRRRTA
jgi:hypothetical protein